MGARRRVRQTAKPVPSRDVHAIHNQHDPAYTAQQYRYEQAAVEQEQIDIYLMLQRKYAAGEQEEQAAA